MVSSLLSERSNRVKVLLSFVTGVFVLSIWTFRELEGLGWLDSFYFLVVTISTVGFGDVTPHHPFTKFILILLIVTGISTIALTSEMVIDKLIAQRLENHYYLPESLDYSNHIVIVGFGNIVLIVSRLLSDRFLKVVLLCEDSAKVIEARRYGIEAYTASSQYPEVLESACVAKAFGLYLFHDEDNLAIQTAIFAKQLNPDIKIYAKTHNHLSIEYGQLVGIDRTYHRGRLVASFLSSTSKSYRRLMLPNQDVPNSIFRILLTWDSQKFCKVHKNAYPTAIIERGFTDVVSVNPEDVMNSNTSDIEMVVMLKDDEFKDFETVEDDIPLRYERIILTGYNEEVKDIVEHLTFESAKYVYLTLDEKEYMDAKQDGAEIIYAPRGKLLEELPEKVTKNDLVVIMFPEITDSLVLSAVLLKLPERPKILQLVEQTYEVDIYRKMGVERVLSPDMPIARGMFLILIKDLDLPISMVYRDSQMFEYVVKSRDMLDEKTVEQISKLGYQVLLMKRESDDGAIQNPQNLVVRESDHVLLYKKYDF